MTAPDQSIQLERRHRATLATDTMGFQAALSAY